jgi:radical SAM superfamily enzyme with C-terminal helix-hairpin-helix motif
MKRTLVRYKTKPEQAEENARLIGKVFQELQATSPDGVRYLVLRLGDGTFLHFVETADGTSPIPALEAFQSFQSGIKERCIDPPQSGDATIVGNYRMLGEL